VRVWSKEKGVNTVLQIAIAIICLFITWRMYKVMKANPEILSKENLTKSFGTMGIVALILIGFVTILVFLVKK
jgi:hypothetical protein